MTKKQKENGMTFKSAGNATQAEQVAEKMRGEGYACTVRKASAQEIEQLTGKPRKRAGWLVEATAPSKRPEEPTPVQEEPAPTPALAQNTGVQETPVSLDDANNMPKEEERVSNTQGEQHASTVPSAEPSTQEEQEVQDASTMPEEQPVEEQPKAKKEKKKKVPLLLRDGDDGDEARAAFIEKYPWVKPGSFVAGGKGVRVTCVCTTCGAEIERNTQDVFQSALCPECKTVARKERRKAARAKKRAEKAQKKASQEEANPTPAPTQEGEQKTPS